jgi:hypothetical protein
MSPVGRRSGRFGYGSWGDAAEASRFHCAMGVKGSMLQRRTVCALPVAPEPVTAASQRPWAAEEAQSFVG